MIAKMKEDNRRKAEKVLSFGEDEVSRGFVVVRDMEISEQTEVKMDCIKSILCKTEVRENG